MEITINGQTQIVSEGLTAAQLIEQMGLAGRRIAMEVNLDIVPRSAYAEHALNPGDRVEIVHAVGGG